MNAYNLPTFSKDYAVPIYEYTCTKCNASFEKLIRSINTDPKADCPKCGSDKTERALSVFAVGTEQSKSAGGSPGCGRCGGPGPCAMG